MIKYGTQRLKVMSGSLSIAKGNRTMIREYPGKDKADYFDLGKKTTRIAMTLKAESESERFNLMSLLHSPTKRDLQLGNIYYKDVVPSQDFDAEPTIDDVDGYYIIPCQLVALDPVPYDASTDEVMY